MDPREEGRELWDGVGGVKQFPCWSDLERNQRAELSSKIPDKAGTLEDMLKAMDELINLRRDSEMLGLNAPRKYPTGLKSDGVGVGNPVTRKDYLAMLAKVEEDWIKFGKNPGPRLSEAHKKAAARMNALFAPAPPEEDGPPDPD